MTYLGSFLCSEVSLKLLFNFSRIWDLQKKNPRFIVIIASASSAREVKKTFLSALFSSGFLSAARPFRSRNARCCSSCCWAVGTIFKSPMYFFWGGRCKEKTFLKLEGISLYASLLRKSSLFTPLLKKRVPLYTPLPKKSFPLHTPSTVLHE